MQAGDRLQRALCFMGEEDRCGGRALHRYLLRLARETGAAAACVRRGLEGVGARGRLHTCNLIELSDDLPLCFEVIGAPERIALFLRRLDAAGVEVTVYLDQVEQHTPEATPGAAQPAVAAPRPG